MVSCQFTNLTLSMFCDEAAPQKGYPFLKGKGAEVKGLTVPLLHVFRKFAKMFAGRAVLPAQSILVALQLQCDFQDLLDSSADEFVMPRADVDRLQVTIDLFLQEYTQLGTCADELGLLLWPMRPKFHWLWHLGQRARYISPRRAACFLDEDYLGKLKKVLAHCTPGLALHKVPAKFLARYRWGIHSRRLVVERL